MDIDFKKFIRDIADFPKPGIVFKDITPLLLDSEAFSAACNEMAKPFKGVDLVVGAEARGFLFAPGVAQILKVGFVPMRKIGKLPGQTVKVDYDLEYGSDCLEVHSGHIPKDSNVLLVDDVLATGGTMEAGLKLVEKCGGNVLGFSFLIELSFLGGRTKLGGKKTNAIMTF